MIVGKINKLVVLRKTDIGYQLTDGKSEVFLHNNESNFSNLRDNQKVDAFLYYDQKGRLAATLKKPLIEIDEKKFLTVKGVDYDLGVFLDMGIAKDLLLSFDYLPKRYENWPQVNDKVYVELKAKSRLIARLVANITDLDINLLQKNTVKEGYVMKIALEGLTVLTEDDYQIFVHNSMYKGDYRIGQKVEVKITYVSDKGYSGSLVKQKEVARFDDADIILNYLIKHKKMKLTASSSSGEVYEVFQMSRNAFKRALGMLYKERKIDFIDGETILK